MDDITYKFITDVDPKPGNAYGLTKCHKESRPLRIIAPGSNTSVLITLGQGPAQTFS